MIKGEELAKFFKSWRGILITFVLVAAVAAGIYFGVFYSKSCDNFSCFQKRMELCRRASYINEEPEATWKYQILGAGENQCAIGVELLQAKEGELGMDKLAGFNMKCLYPLGIGAYPEKDLKRCHGKLKEELQEITIFRIRSDILNEIDLSDESELVGRIL